MKSNLKPHLAVLGANVFFGINYSAVQYITKGFVHPFAINFLRVGVSALLFWVLIFFYPNKAGIQKKHVPRFILCALTGVVINQLLFIKGLSLTLSIHAALLALVTPIFITFVATWLGHEKFTPYTIAGFALGISGAVMLVLKKEVHGSGSNILLGNILIIINAISYSFYFVLVKPLMKEYSAMHVIRWLFTFGLPFMIFFGWKDFTQIQWHLFTIKEYAALGLIVIGATFFAYLFNLYGINKLGAGITGSYIYTQPVFATLIAVFLLGESLTLYKLFAAALIIVGVVLAGRKKT